MYEEIDKFVKKMHLLSFCVSFDNKPYCASAFYAYDEKNSSLIFASDEKTSHIQMALKNPILSGIIHLDTKIVGNIKGVQLLGEFKKANEEQKKIYFKRFPYALALKPSIWCMEISWAKFTNNKAIFGKKLIWEKAK